MHDSFATYDISRSYEWNYEHPPSPRSDAFPTREATSSFCGLPVETPLGIAAGPLLNGDWVLYYASLGYSVLTYKTVRSVARESYPLPNLLPVRATSLSRPGEVLQSSDRMHGSWAISFGMPSKPPDVWRSDIERTRSKMPRNTVLSVSVVGTERDGGTLDDLATDYAKCARWAVESGAQVIEANFSCPNVCSSDGQLDHDPQAAGLVAAAIREAIGTTPLLLKIGFIADQHAAAALVRAVSPFATGFAMTNCIQATVRHGDGTFAFNGQPRGIGGTAIRDAAIEQVRRFRELAPKLFLVGVGGVASEDDVRDCLAAGANAVHIATAAMVTPGLALDLRRGDHGDGSL